ncbi:XRE family transcriptional regulator [Streptomyces sp. BBFR2]|uniref:XRE family transcriptional regulator n=1 Tax=Streptomyces sp. BBFR2 TaxID=3372854 RepID=UPI0037D99275
MSGKTHQRIADEINDRDGRATVTGKEVSRYLREKRIPTSRVRGYLADVFGIDLAVLDRAAAVSRQRRRESAPDVRSVEQEPARSLLAADAAEAADFARFIAGTNTSATALEGLHADVTRLARHYVSRPLAELYEEIGTLRRATFKLLEGRQRPADTAELYLLAGRLCGLSAHICLDAGDYDSAATQSRTAWACADLVGHNGLRAWTRAAQSLIAFWNGSPRQAAELARAGQEYTAPGSIGARLASLEARSLAVAGDRSGAAAALATAQLQRENTTGEDEFPGIFSFPMAKQFTYAGTTHLAIGGQRHVQAAITSAETAVRLYRNSEDADRSVGDLFAAHLDIARGHMKAGDIDGTEAMIRFVLDARPETRSASIARRLGELSSELGAPEFRDSAPVTRLRERLKEATMSTALPARGQEQQT